ncbi:MAG: lipocalin-like domain-containing protein [Spirochaetaceae bacterium]|nr:lipocalin-like domain-containing protein [Myxococcales bacterium]MCB9724415.1 lipocalin-like domain-containing protein [Spirochaetaceae bacterium]HPG28047.1 lipocalin-like domain-containing protein [Myxococcota bacterium]
MKDGEELIGSWKLETFELRTGEGAVHHPYGEALTGYLFYNEDGFMSAAFMAADRGPRSGPELSEAARVSSYDRFMAYSGPFEVRGDRITHDVEVSSLEAWIGTVQERWFKIDGDRLELLTAPLSVGADTPVGRLTWTRVTKGQARS